MSDNINIRLQKKRKIFMLAAQLMFFNDIEVDDEEIEVLLQTNTAGAATLWSGAKRPRIQNYVEITVPKYSDWEFKCHFRLSRTTFEHVLRLVGPKLMNSASGGRPTISPVKQLLFTLWAMATPDSLRSEVDRFDIGKDTAMVTDALCKLSPFIIKWPSIENMGEIVQGFHKIKSFPGTIGAIDGTHIYIPAPREHPESYINRLGKHSIVMQAVCDHNLVYTHIYIGQPGFVHDARVFKLSEVADYALNNADVKFPDDTHIIGDPAYFVLRHVLSPYRDNGHLSLQQKNFNYCLSATRCTIERSFGLLKGRFRSLLFLNMHCIKRMSKHILACCVLHNICQSHGDILEVEEIVIEYMQPDPFVGDNEGLLHGNRDLGNAKRVEITRLLPIVIGHQ